MTSASIKRNAALLDADFKFSRFPAHLKPPEVKKFEIDVGVKNEGGIEDLKATMRELAQTQLQAIERGMGVKDLAARKLTAIDAETVNDDDDR